MITGNIPPVDGGGRVPQPIKPDPNKNGQNAGPTVSQDMAAIVAQSGQLVYVPTQILPDDNSDRGHDSYTPSNKSTNKEKKKNDSNLHFPTNTKEFKVLSENFNNWVQSMQENVLVAEGPVQDANNVVLGAEDEFHYVEPPKVSYTSTVSGDNKMSEFVDSWSDFISNFDFSSMSGSKGMVAWAMMMNYVKSAIWASALTSGDIEALMEQFKAMIEQLKSAADVKKTLALKQAEQVGKQIETLDDEGMKAISAAWKNIATSALGIGLSMASEMSKNTAKDKTGSFMSDEPKDPRMEYSPKKALGKIPLLGDKIVSNDVYKSVGMAKARASTNQSMGNAAEKAYNSDNSEVRSAREKHGKLSDVEQEKGFIFKHTFTLEPLNGSAGGEKTIEFNSKERYKQVKEGGERMVDLIGGKNEMGKITGAYGEEYEKYYKGFGISKELYEERLKARGGDHKAVLEQDFKIHEMMDNAVKHKEANERILEVYDPMMDAMDEKVGALHRQYAPDRIPESAYAEAISGVLKDFETKFSGELYKPAFDDIVKDFNSDFKVKLKTWGSCALPNTNDTVNGVDVEALYLQKRDAMPLGEHENHKKLEAQLEAHYTKTGRDHVAVEDLVRRRTEQLEIQYEQYFVENPHAIRPPVGSGDELALKRQLFQSEQYKYGVEESFKTALSGKPDILSRLTGNKDQGVLGWFSEKRQKVAKELNAQNEGMKQIRDANTIEKQNNASAQAKAQPKQTFSPELIGQIFSTLATFFKVQQDQFNLLKERNNLVAETAKQLISGEREASSQMLEGMLQIMQKVLDALVTMNQNLRQTATQSAASLQISTF